MWFPSHSLNSILFWIRTQEYENLFMNFNFYAYNMENKRSHLKYFVENLFSSIFTVNNFRFFICTIFLSLTENCIKFQVKSTIYLFSTKKKNTKKNSLYLLKAFWCLTFSTRNWIEWVRQRPAEKRKEFHTRNSFCPELICNWCSSARFRIKE